MSAIPPEISEPIKGFLYKRWLIILIVISCLLIGYISVLLLWRHDVVEEGVEKVIASEIGMRLDLTH